MGKILDFVEENLFDILILPLRGEHKDWRIDPRKGVGLGYRKEANPPKNDSEFEWRHLESISSRSRDSSFNFRVVLWRIRLFPTLISKIKWIESELPEKMIVCMTYHIDLLSSSSTLLSSNSWSSLDQTFCSIQVPNISTPHNTIWFEIRLFVVVFSGIDSIWPLFWWDIILIKTFKGSLVSDFGD